MRQVNIKILQARLSYELKKLPFEITKNGKVIAKCIYNMPESVTDAKEKQESAQGIYNGQCEQQPNNITKKQKVVTAKATIPTGVLTTITPNWKNPLEGSALAPKK